MNESSLFRAPDRLALLTHNRLNRIHLLWCNLQHSAMTRNQRRIPSFQTIVVLTATTHPCASPSLAARRISAITPLKIPLTTGNILRTEVHSDEFSGTMGFDNLLASRASDTEYRDDDADEYDEDRIEEVLDNLRQVSEMTVLSNPSARSLFQASSQILTWNSTVVVG